MPASAKSYGGSAEGGKEKIAKIIKEEIKPYLNSHGGDIELVEVTKGNVVKVRLVGACQGCPMANLTLTGFVEELIKSKVPEVKEVEAVN